MTQLDGNNVTFNMFNQESWVCEPNVVQLRARRLGISIYKFRVEFDLHGTSMGPNPEGFGNLSREY